MILANSIVMLGLLGGGCYLISGAVGWQTAIGITLLVIYNRNIRYK